MFRYSHFISEYYPNKSSSNGLLVALVEVVGFVSTSPKGSAEPQESLPDSIVVGSLSAVNSLNSKLLL